MEDFLELALQQPLQQHRDGQRHLAEEEAAARVLAGTALPQQPKGHYQPGLDADFSKHLQYVAQAEHVLRGKYRSRRPHLLHHLGALILETFSWGARLLDEILGDKPRAARPTPSQ